MVKKAPKDPQFAQKLEDQARKMFGRAYRFLNATQKAAVNAETKFEPKEESNVEHLAGVHEPVRASNGEGNRQENNGADKTGKPEETTKAAPAPVLKHAEPFVDYVTQHKCEAGHITNGKVTAPPLGCRICDKPVKKIGYYVNDIFVPVEK